MVPKFEDFLYPFLNALKDGPKKLSDMKSTLKKHFNLSDEDCSASTKNGSTTQFADRIGWTRQYFRRAELIEIPQRGIYKITSKGKDFLEHHPTIKISDLETIPEFHAFSQRNGKKETEVSQEQESTTMEATPSERMENAYSDIEANLSAELKDKIIKATPAFFEKIVVNLLVAMGYGGDLEDAATVTQPTRDGGIDGVIKEDPLGLDKIYVQAKRWSGMVGVHEIRDFGSALDEVKASKGVIITTSDFTQDAIKSAEKQSKKIVLINGQALTSYMIKYNIGVSVKKEYIIKKIDNDYFEEEE